MEVKVLQLHKRPSEIFENIQDKFSVNENLNCYALADGTTQSFRSEIWADLICKNFQTNPTFEIESLLESFKLSSQQFKKIDFKFSENLAIASLQKTKKKDGGTATFLGMEIENNNNCKVINCGDTNLFYIKKGNIDFFPFNNREEIDKSNFFINSENIFEENFDKTQIRNFEFIFQENSTIILATDALSRLFLSENKFIYDILKIDNFEQFHAFCLNNWESRTLEEDDISAIIISNKTSNSYLEVLPPIDFHFPKNETQNKIIDFKTTQDMNEINNKIGELQRNLSQIKAEIKSIKKSKKINFILTIFAIALGLLNIFGLYKIANNQSISERKGQLEISNEKATKHNYSKSTNKNNYKDEKLETDSNNSSISSSDSATTKN